jgi:predicted nucleic acid-binding protein
MHVLLWVDHRDLPVRVIAAFTYLWTVRCHDDGSAAVPFDAAAVEEYGRIRTDLERAGTPIGGHDLLIAAAARRHDAIGSRNRSRRSTLLV